MTFYKILAPTLLLFLTACTSERTPYWGQNMAEFIVSTPTAEAIASGQDEFNLTNKQRYLFNACITDLDGQRLPEGLVFVVQTNSSDSVESITNVRGCIDWEREIGYSQINSEKNYVLKTKFISKNKIKGTFIVDLVLNPITGKVSDLQDRSNAKKDDLVVVENDKINIQRIDRNNPQPAPRERSADELVITNVLPEVRNQAAYQVVIDGFGLEKRRLDIAKPYSVDSHLNVSTHNIYKLSAKPQFLVKRFNNQVELLSPKTGKFRMTLAFMAEPDFDINEVWKRVEGLKILEDVKNLNDVTAIRREAFEKNISRILTTRASELKKELSLNDKRILMSQLMLPFVHQTHQTVVVMTADFGLQTEINVALDQTSLFQKRAMIAITVEPISRDLENAVKADGAGLAPNMFAISSISNFLPMRIEADLIHRERQSFLRANQVPKAMQIFESTSAPKNRVFKIADTLPGLNSIYHGKDLFDKIDRFLQGQLSKSEMFNLHRALCYNFYMHGETKNIPLYLRTSLVRSCSNDPRGRVLETGILSFVDTLPQDKVNLQGHVIPYKLSTSQNFSKSSSRSEVLGSTTSASLGWDFGLNLDFSPHPKTSGAFKASIGQSWFQTDTTAKSTSGTQDTSLSSSFNLIIEASTFEIQYNAQKCLLFKLSDEAASNMTRQNFIVPQGIYYCSKAIQPASFIETYFLVRQDCISGSAFADCSSDQENTLTLMIRGNQEFLKFKNIVTNSNFDTLLMPVSGEELKKQIPAWENRLKTNATTQVFPGAVVTPIQLN